MMLFKGTIKEVLTRDVYIDAPDEGTAKEKMMQNYAHSEIVLTADDFCYNEFEIDEANPEEIEDQEIIHCEAS